MTYRVELIHSDEGYSVACPDLPGCFSQGESEEEAMSNIKSAITEYLAFAGDRQALNLPEREIRYVHGPSSSAGAMQLEPFKVTPIAMNMPPFTKAEDLLDELEGPCRR